MSITKLLAFKLTKYKRVLHLDSDITLLQHLDELFLLPKTPIAMPRAYWSDMTNDGQWPFTSLMILLEPNVLEFTELMNLLKLWSDQGSKRDRYDMDLLNARFAFSATTIPHRPYALLSAEFRRRDHLPYLGDDGTAWNPDKMFAEAKLVHFSDWPLPKPWIMWPRRGLAELQPDCGDSFASLRGGAIETPCRDREIWKELYEDFRIRRRDICRILSVPAPSEYQWALMKGESGNNMSMTN